MIPTGHIEAATYTNLQCRLSSLQSLIIPDDCFHFWGYDHGYNDTYTSTTPATENGGGLCSWNPSWTTQADYAIPDNVFASWVNPIEAYAESYIFGNCFSGNMQNELNISTKTNN